MTDETRTIAGDVVDDLFNGSKPVEPWTRATQQHISEHRWYDRYWLVLKHDDGTHWGLKYEVGKTEMQETEWPWEATDEPLELTRLYPREVMRVEYDTVPAAVVES